MAAPGPRPGRGRGICLILHFRGAEKSSLSDPAVLTQE